jgi:hypothetical protein
MEEYGILDVSIWRLSVLRENSKEHMEPKRTLNC